MIVEPKTDPIPEDVVEHQLAAYQEIGRNIDVLLAADAYEWPKGHYLMLVYERKDGTTREYVPLVSVEETAEEALGRWIEQHPDMQGRQRNVQKTRDRLRSEVSWMRLCHPSSWLREQRESEPAKPAKRSRRRR